MHTSNTLGATWALGVTEVNTLVLVDLKILSVCAPTTRLINPYFSDT
jgi:hypothetical protein